MESTQLKAPPARPRRTKVLRFRASERRVHWAIAIPFLVCYTTALVMVVVYNPDPLRPYREGFSWTHRISGVCLIVFPLLAVARSTGDLRVYFYNIRQAWSWVLDDVKWLALMGLAAVSRRISLPLKSDFQYVMPGTMRSPGPRYPRSMRNPTVCVGSTRLGQM